MVVRGECRPDPGFVVYNIHEFEPVGLYGSRGKRA